MKLNSRSDTYAVATAGWAKKLVMKLDSRSDAYAVATPGWAKNCDSLSCCLCNLGSKHLVHPPPKHTPHERPHGACTRTALAHSASSLVMFIAFLQKIKLKKFFI